MSYINESLSPAENAAYPHTNETCHLRTSHVASEWVMWHMKASCHISRSPESCQRGYICTLKRDMSRANKSGRKWMGRDACEWDISCCMWMRHFTYQSVPESCWECRRLTCAWVLSSTNESCRMWMSHVASEWVTSPVNESLSLVEDAAYAHANESCHVRMSHVTSEWVMSRVNGWLSPVGDATYFARSEN